MLLNDTVSRALHELKQQVAKEQDPEGLRALVKEIDAILDAIEKQAAKLERGG
jgi:hypothetical protein